MNKSFDRVLSKIEEYVLSFSIIAMAILLIVSVVMRAVFNSSLTFSEEIGLALLVLVSFFGLEYCARKGRHISMSIIFDKVSNKNKKRFMILISSVSFIVMTYLSYIAFKYILSVKRFGTVTPALQIPMYIVYLVVPIGFLIGAIEYLRTSILNIKEKDLYLTSEIRVPIDKEITTDLSNLIDSVSSDNGEV